MNSIGHSKYFCFRSLVCELRDENSEFFYKYMRMQPATFKRLLAVVKPRIEKKDTNWRESISAEERLAVTLRYLGHGDSMTLLSLTYRIGHSTVCKIIRETTRVIWDELQPDFLPKPTVESFEETERGFRERWQVPSAVGAIDGKHVRIQCPHNSGSLYYCYKQFFSVVLMAVCDYDHKFTLVDIGSYGCDL